MFEPLCTAKGSCVIEGVDHVQLACPAGSEDVLRGFYGGVLGMTEVAKPPALAARGGAWFRSGTAEIHCGVETDFRPAGKAHPGLLCTDLDAIVAACTGAGYEVSWDANFPGFRRCYVSDPVGNRLEFMQPI